jgi:hypothetical protein
VQTHQWPGSQDNEHKRVRQAPGIDQTRDVGQKFLRAFERKHWTRQISAAYERALDRISD